jgi:hypothetical protein
MSVQLDAAQVFGRDIALRRLAPFFLAQVHAV